MSWAPPAPQRLTVIPVCLCCAGFIGFDSDASCEEAYFKMNNVLIDDRWGGVCLQKAEIRKAHSLDSASMESLRSSKEPLKHCAH